MNLSGRDRSFGGRGRATLAFNRILKTLELRASKKRRYFSPFVDSDVVRRIQQVQCARFYEPFCVDYLAYGEASAVESWTKSIVSVGLYQFLRGFFLYLVGWWWVLFLFTGKVLTCRRSKGGPSGYFESMGMGYIDSERSDGEFSLFCESGPIVPLNKCSAVWVNCAPPPVCQVNTKLKYGKHAIIGLVASHASIRDLFIFLTIHIGFAGRYFVLLVFDPMLCLVARDFLFSPFFVLADQRRWVSDVFLSDANFDRQELFLCGFRRRSFRVHFLWHSHNVSSFVFSRDPVEWSHPARRLMAMDKNWGWVPSFNEWLKINGIDREYEAVGPIVFKTTVPRSVTQAEVRGPVRIGLFDVTPTTAKWQSERGWDYLYYNSETCRSFIVDILQSPAVAERRAGGRIQVLLKEKREHSSIHDQGYVQLVKHEQQAGRLAIVDPRTNLESFIDSCDLVIAIPFTSAALYSKLRGIRSFYFNPDPNNMDVDRSRPINEVEVVSGRENLNSYLAECLSVIERIKNDKYRVETT